MKTRFHKFFFGFLVVAIILHSLFSKKESNNLGLTKYNVTFNKIDGVQIGTKVMISGIEVGYINDIFLKKSQ